MIALTKITARDFGEALKAAREEAHATLEGISDRTKISVRMLSALEAGELGKLPNQMFARMFLRQYLEFIGAAPEQWLQAFDIAWRRSAESSQPYAVWPAAPVKARRPGPWILGLAIVAVGIVGVLLVESRHSRRSQPPVAAPAATRTAPAAPRPAATQAVAQTVPAEPVHRPDALLIRTGGSSCWVEVHVAGESPSSRLLAADTAWEVPAGGKDVDLTLGDAGAVSVEYLGQTRSPAGQPGEVAHLHFPGAPAQPAQR